MSKEKRFAEEQEIELNKLSEQEIVHAMEPIEHDWVQRGSDLECHSCTNPHGQINVVPPGKMLVKNEKGVFDIIPITSS